MQKTDYDENRFENWFKKYKSYLKPIDYLIRFISIIILLLAVIELSSFALVKVYESQKADSTWFLEGGGTNPQPNSDFFLNESNAKKYFIEFQESGKAEYYPYLGYRRLPNYSGDYINLDENSIRKTINKCEKASKKIKIFMFGGSTMWGTGARDEGTIPSLLSNELCKNDIQAEVTNFGEDGYVNTQEMIKLQLELRNGNIPDIAIFYDGVNDVYSSFQTFIVGHDEAGLPQNNENRIKDFNSRDRFNLVSVFPNFYRILHSKKTMGIFGSENQLDRNINPQLINETANIYLNNIRMIKSFEKEYDFKSFFYWQPTIYTKSIRTEAEKNISDNSNQLADMFIQTSKEAVKSKDVRDLTQIFNNINSTIYFDWCHISEKGNGIIAKDMAEDVQKYLNK